MKAQATPANIQSWLESKDPRMIAWGAYFARENSDDAALAVAAGVVKESLYQGGPDLLSPSRPQQDAMSQILDALIQKRVLLSAELLGYLAPSYPVQSIILLSMLPPAEQTERLLQWYGGGLSDSPSGIVRVSAMMLSKVPPPGFAASVLAGSEEQPIIYIVPSKNLGMGSGGGFGMTCGDYAGPRDPDGWPDRILYDLRENDKSRANPLLVEAGGDRITWQRLPSHEGRGSCYGVKPLSMTTRHRLLAEMLEQRDETMSWPTRKTINIAKESDDQVKRDVGDAILVEQAILQSSVQDFLRRGLITAKEATGVLPKLSVTIRYEDSLKPR
jgi:hypothetical protein